MPKKTKNKKSAAKGSARRKRRSTALSSAKTTSRIAPRRTAHIARVAAAAAECLEMPAAVALVKGCLGGTLVGLDTKLGDLFPDPDARNQFCQCVATGAGVSRAKIPCAPTNTVGEVIDAIAC